MAAAHARGGVCNMTLVVGARRVRDYETDASTATCEHRVNSELRAAATHSAATAGLRKRRVCLF